MPEQPLPELKVLKPKVTDDRACTKATTRIELEARGLFPARVPITQRTYGYLEHEVDSWILSRVRLRDASEAEKRADPILSADLTRRKRGDKS